MVPFHTHFVIHIMYVFHYRRNLCKVKMGRRFNFLSDLVDLEWIHSLLTTLKWRRRSWHRVSVIDALDTFKKCVILYCKGVASQSHRTIRNTDPPLTNAQSDNLFPHILSKYHLLVLFAVHPDPSYFLLLLMTYRFPPNNVTVRESLAPRLAPKRREKKKVATSISIKKEVPAKAEIEPKLEIKEEIPFFPRLTRHEHPGKDSSERPQNEPPAKKETENTAQGRKKQVQVPRQPKTQFRTESNIPRQNPPEENPLWKYKPPSQLVRRNQLIR